MEKIWDGADKDWMNGEEIRVWKEISEYDKMLGLVNAFAFERYEENRIDEHWLSEDEKDELRSKILKQLPHLKGKKELENVLDYIYMEDDKNVELEEIGYKVVLFMIVKDHRILWAEGVMVKEEIEINYIEWARSYARRKKDKEFLKELEKGVDYVIYREDGDDVFLDNYNKVISDFILDMAGDFNVFSLFFKNDDEEFIF